MLQRLARSCYRRRWLVLALWIVALASATTLASIGSGEFENDFRLPGSESQQAFDLLEQRFPAQAGDTANIVFHAPGGLDNPEIRLRAETLLAKIAKLDHVSEVRSPYAPEARGISANRAIGLGTIQFDVRGPEVPRSLITNDLRGLVRAGDGDGLQVELGGPVIQFAESSGPGGSEGIGLLAAITVLLVAFGSLVAMGIPIVTAIFALGLGIALIELGANVVSVPEFGPQLAAMIGLGVGIDYALFILNRFRQYLDSGLDPEDATVAAINTSGRAIVFAGATVIISLLGMFFTGLTFTHGLALSASFVVMMTVFASITLLPAMLGFAGHNVNRFRIPGLGRKKAGGTRASVWRRWSQVVQRHPWRAAVPSLLLLLVLAAPALSIQLGSVDAGNDPTTRTARRAYDLLAEGFGPGFNGPLLLVADLSRAPRSSSTGTMATSGAAADSLATFAQLGRELGKLEGIELTSPPVPNPAGDTAVMTIYPTTSPQSEATEALIKHLRRDVIPNALKGTNIEVHVGGITAVFIDIANTLGERLLFFIGSVVFASFILLMAVFRSVLVPLKAALMNLLSISAAYGVVVAVFQWGWFNELVGVDRTGPIESFLPLMLFAILFGLSMDYEIFLLSRIREEYLRTGNTNTAVAEGLATTAKVITAAAAIMITVFLSFVLGDERIIKIFGVGLASAVLIDATVVRMILVPSLMELFGDANWWLPRWLDRLLPSLHIEAAEEPTV